MKKILSLTIAIVLIIGVVAGGTWAYFSDTETATGNVFTAGTIDISLNPSGGQDVTTVEGYVDLKPCQTGYIPVLITNDGTNPADIWKHIANVENREHGISDAEAAFYAGTPASVDWLISNWIHYDLLACFPFEETYDTIGAAVEANIVKEWVCCTTTWTVDITSVNVPHGFYGIGLVISLDGITPSFQVWYADPGAIPAGYTETGWYYGPYPWGSAPQPVSAVDWIQVNDRDPTDQHFEISIDCAHLGGPGATYYWNMQLRTNNISWVGGAYNWGPDVSGFGFLVNHVGTYEVEIPEAAGFMLTGPHFTGGVECNWIYLGVLQPGESMFVLQSYHLDETVDNWGQSDRVFFDMEFFAQQTEGSPPPPGTELPGYERP
ncbi:hypothetical protein ES703_08561 [subsurface metagenome]